MPGCDPDQVLHIKTGSTLILKLEYHDDSDPPIPLSLAGYTIFMDFIHPKTKVPLFKASFENGIAVTDELAGKYLLTAGDIVSWPLGLMGVDIKYVKLGVTQHTETFYLDIKQGITK